MSTIYRRGRKTGLWVGQNPFEDVETRRIAKRIHTTLKAEEVPLVLRCAPEQWRNFFAAALYGGLRKGELCGLRKKDVDLDAKVMLIARSYDNNCTKGRHEDLIPIAEPLVPFLQNAIDESPSELVFPDESGQMRTKLSALLSSEPAS